MQKRRKTDEEDRASTDSLQDIIRAGAHQLMAQALKAEVPDLLATYADQRDEQGHARVVLSGHHPERDIQIRGFNELLKVVAGIQFIDGLEQAATDSVAA